MAPQQQLAVRPKAENHGQKRKQQGKRESKKGTKPSIYSRRGLCNKDRDCEWQHTAEASWPVQKKSRKSKKANNGHGTPGEDGSSTEKKRMGQSFAQSEDTTPYFVDSVGDAATADGLSRKILHGTGPVSQRGRILRPIGGATEYIVSKDDVAIPVDNIVTESNWKMDGAAELDGQ